MRGQRNASRGRDRARRARPTWLLVGALALVLAACDLGAPPVAYPTFGAMVGYRGLPAGNSAEAHAVGDVDGDGDPDIVTVGEGDAAFGLLVNDGSGGFAAPISVPHGLCPPDDPPGGSCVARARGIIDVDGDGVQDVWLNAYGTSAPDLAVLGGHGSGPGSFGPPIPLVTESFGYTQTFLDVTGDGIADRVALTDPFEVGVLDVGVQVGDGTGGFAPNVVTTVPSTHLIAAVDAADIDEDGIPDLVVDGGCVDLGGGGPLRVVGCVDVLFGDGAGAFSTTARLTVPDPAVDVLDAAIGDVDDDGHLDIVAGTTSADEDGEGRVGVVEVFLGDGTGAFADAVAVPAPMETQHVDLADFDGDGHVDLLGSVSGSGGYERVLFGDGGGGFGDPHLLPASTFTIADLDGDGRPDVVGPKAVDEVQVLLNRWDGRPE